MKSWIIRLTAIFAICAVVVVIIFLAIQLSHPELMKMPLTLIDHAGWLPALLSIGLLSLDVYLPVPSSILLTLNGKFFGLSGGILLNIIGGVASGIVAWYTGQLLSLKTTAPLSPEEQQHAQRLLQQWGLLAVICSRPIPILAEAIAVTAAASGMKGSLFFLGILLGTLPIAVLYAFAGAYAQSFAAGTISFTLVMVVSLLCYLLGRRFHTQATQHQGADESETPAS